ncbi:MAG: FtsQ-type POTRA domain-containing protein [Hyphomicrobiaceae bacterium]|nr:MAG: FtsQ-type POTRA domain-containing protein [Hyphomicrobiaceae bacterium]
MDRRGRFFEPLTSGEVRRGGGGAVLSSFGRGRRRARSASALSALARWPRTAAFLCLSLAAAGWVASREEPLRAPEEAKAQLGQVLADLGFSLDQVVLTGHRFTSDAAIFDALGSETSPFALDLGEAKRRIERLPWIEHASLVRRLPDTLLIEVRERKPFAIWHRGDKRYLIDVGGRMLAETDGHGFSELPQFAGEGAQSEAQRLSSALLAVPEIGRRVTLAERVGQRRWRLRLGQGPFVDLPERNMEAALQRLDKLHIRSGILDAGFVSIDLRLSDRVALRTKPGTKPRAGPRLSSL